MPSFFLDTDSAPLQERENTKKGKSKRNTSKKQKNKEAFASENDSDPKPFDPVDEYRTLLDLTEDSRKKTRKGRPELPPVAEPDVYSDLMAKERRVLDTVDRVVNDAVETRRQVRSPLSGMPVHEVAMRTMGALRSLWDDLISAQSLKDVLDALQDPSRVMYLGIALVALAVLMSLVVAMSNSNSKE